MANERNTSFEFFRLLSIFGVIGLHIPFDNISSPFSVDIFRLSFRWCVPFFFILSGYFLSSSNGFPDITMARLKRLLIIVFSANVLFLPVLIYFKHLGFLSKDLFITGTWFHLWFLNSMVVFYLLIIGVSGFIFSRILVSFISLIIFSLFYFIDLMSAFDPSHYYGYLGLIRQFEAIPFMWFGFILSQIHISSRKKSFYTSLLLIIFGLVISLLEVYLLHLHGANVDKRTLLIGGVILCVGFIFFARSLKFSAKLSHHVNKISSHVLTIYIFHPFSISLVFYCVKKVTTDNLILLVLTSCFVFLLSLCASLFLEKVLPSFYSLFRGNVVFFNKKSVNV